MLNVWEIFNFSNAFDVKCYKFCTSLNLQCSINISLQGIKTFSIREGWWCIGIKGDGGAKSKGTSLLIENE